MTLLRIDTSIRFDGSVSRELADIAERAWTGEHPDVEVVRRDLGRDPLPAGLWPALASGRGDELLGPDGSTAADFAARLTDELVSAEAVIVGTSLYNFGIAEQLKTWVDVIAIDRRPAGGELLRGRPMVLAVARGGGYGPGTPREGWDHATPWMLRIFGDLWGMDVRLTTAELTLADTTPHMESLRAMAAQSRDEARRVAHEHGTAVARLRPSHEPAA